MLTDRAFSELFSDLDAEPVERRTNPRATVLVTAAVSCDDGVFIATTRDLSDGGVFLLVSRQLPIGTMVDLEIALPNGLVSVHGTVKWTRTAAEGGEGFGVELADVSERALRTIAEYRAGIGAVAGEASTDAGARFTA